MRKAIRIIGFALALTVGGALASVATSAPSAQASPARLKVATFAVANMTCATCPITVKKAMSAVDGVRSVQINFETKTATVEFDPSATNAAAIAAASTSAGYRATPKG